MCLHLKGRPTLLCAPSHLPCDIACARSFCWRETIILVEVKWACNKVAYEQPPLPLFYHYHYFPDIPCSSKFQALLFFLVPRDVIWFEKYPSEVWRWWILVWTEFFWIFEYWFERSFFWIFGFFSADNGYIYFVTICLISVGYSNTVCILFLGSND